MTMISPDHLDRTEQFLSVAEKIVVLCTAFVAAIKFKVFRLWKQSYRTEMQCGHTVTANKNIVFWADYTIVNTGDRPLHVARVQLELRYAEEQNGNLVPSVKTLHGLLPTVVTAEAEEIKSAGQIHFKPIGPLGYIGKGERSIFTLRCRISDLPDVVFVLGEFWERDTLFNARQSKTSSYTSMYLRDSHATPAR